MNEREKQDNLLSEAGLFDDLLLKEEPKNSPSTGNPTTESKAINILDMMGFEQPTKTENTVEAVDMLELTEMPPVANNEEKAAPAPVANKAAQEFNLDFLTLNDPVPTAAPKGDQIDEIFNIFEDTLPSISYHPWRISLYKALPFICEAEGAEKVFLIGYKNGQTARDKETHFAQHEADPIPYVISLDPDPHFISYSFFYGFFRETVEKMCHKYMNPEELRVTIKKKITDEFFKKYTFDFRKNPQLLSHMGEYVDTMTENIMESLYKKEELNFNNGCL